MSNHAHTPGPWVRMARGGVILPYNVATADGYYNDIECLVAYGTYTGGNGWPTIDKGQRIANANLIAAAPDLLEASCELVASMIAYEWDVSAEVDSVGRLIPNSHREMMLRARAAISKARGFQ